MTISANFATPAPTRTRDGRALNGVGIGTVAECPEHRTPTSTEAAATTRIAATG